MPWRRFTKRAGRHDLCDEWLCLGCRVASGAELHIACPVPLTARFARDPGSSPGQALSPAGRGKTERAARVENPLCLFQRPRMDAASHFRLSQFQQVCNALHTAFAQISVASQSGRATGTLGGRNRWRLAMRRYIALALMIAITTLATVLWPRSSVEVTNATTVRPDAAISPHEIMLRSKDLPVEHMENPM